MSISMCVGGLRGGVGTALVEIERVSVGRASFCFCTIEETSAAHRMWRALSRSRFGRIHVRGSVHRKCRLRRCAMPYIAALVNITQRSQEGRAVHGASKSAQYSIRYELESQRHRRMMSGKLAGSTAGVSQWSSPMWFGTQELCETTPAAESWAERKRYRGTFVALALLELPGVWAHGPMCMLTEEHRYFADLAHVAGSDLLAFFHVQDIVCIGSFCGASEPAIPPADLLPQVWSAKHQRFLTDFREDVVPLDGAPWMGLPLLAGDGRRSRNPCRSARLQRVCRRDLVGVDGTMRTSGAVGVHVASVAPDCSVAVPSCMGVFGMDRRASEPIAVVSARASAIGQAWGHQRRSFIREVCRARHQFASLVFAACPQGCVGDTFGRHSVLPGVFLRLGGMGGPLRA